MSKKLEDLLTTLKLPEFPSSAFTDDNLKEYQDKLKSCRIFKIGKENKEIIGIKDPVRPYSLLKCVDIKQLVKDIAGFMYSLHAENAGVAKRNQTRSIEKEFSKIYSTIRNSIAGVSVLEGRDRFPKRQYKKTIKPIMELEIELVQRIKELNFSNLKENKVHVELILFGIFRKYLPTASYNSILKTMVPILMIFDIERGKSDLIHARIKRAFYRLAGQISSAQ